MRKLITIISILTMLLNAAYAGSQEVFILRPLASEEKGPDELLQRLDAANGTPNIANAGVQTESLENTVMEFYRQGLPLTFLHGIHPNFIPVMNSLLRYDVDWITKLEIMLALNPVASASSISPGDTPAKLNMWSRMGVMLSGGEITNASFGDMGTMAKKANVRKGHGGEVLNINTKIKDAVTQRGQVGHNEFMIKESGIAGFYVCLDEAAGHNDLVSMDEINRVASRFGLPVYVLREGLVYETAGYDESASQFIEGSQIDPTDILKRKFQLSAAHREEIMKKLCAQLPFNIEPQSALFVDSRDSGRSAYVEINVPNAPEAFEGEEVEYKPARNESGHVITYGAIVKDILRFSARRSRIRYFVHEGRLYKSTENKTNGGILVSSMNGLGEFGNSYIKLGVFTHNIGRPITDNEAYLVGMEESIKQDMAKRTELLSASMDARSAKQIALIEERIRLLAMHLYGFGEQAGYMGDTDIQQRAFDLAERIISRSEYKEFIARRVGEDGQFKLTRKELLSLLYQEDAEDAIGSILAEIDFSGDLREELNAIIQPEGPSSLYNPEALLNFAAERLGCRDIFEQEVDVESENRTLGQHTLRVMQTFEEFVIDGLPEVEGLNVRALMRFALAFHDVGKPIAMARGDATMQHVYTARITNEIMNGLGFAGGEKNFVIALIGADPIGKVVSGKDKQASVDEEFARIEQLAKHTGLRTDIFFEMLTGYFTADAYAYSKIMSIFEMADGRLIVKRMVKEFYELRTRALSAASASLKGNALLSGKAACDDLKHPQAMQQI
ncbi:MAG: hypothetical protein ABH825_03385 [Candidatus Omnitrophota bacterium]